MSDEYLDLLNEVLEIGEKRGDRTGIGTLSLFGRQMRFDLSKGFPAVTTKQLAFKSCVAEMLFFIEGSSDERRLAEIQHGTRDPAKKTIWTANANSPYWKPKADYEGDLGRIYGVQWRSWRSGTGCIDQLANVIDKLKNNPTDRRIFLTAMNVGEFDQMALPPCHLFAQFYVNLLENKLSCQVYIRSSDLFLGAPFNIAGYAVLVHMLAQITGRNVGELILIIGDAHIYLNHVNQVKEQLLREPLPPPKLWVNPKVDSIDGFTLNDFALLDYKFHPAIIGDMAV